MDFSCAFVILQLGTSGGDYLLCLLLYNFCAFALQMTFGILVDRLNRNALIAAIGCILVAASYGLWHFPIVVAVIAGVGNSLFHVGGGVDVMNLSLGKSGMLGVFVSPGALGLYFGTMLSRGVTGYMPLMAVAAIVAATSILITKKTVPECYVSNSSFSVEPQADRRAIIALVLLFVVVILRSYFGLAMVFPWKQEGFFALILVIGVVLGKTAGGFLRDKIGAVPASILSLGIAAALFCFSGNPISGITAVFLFNMTMPITLWAMARILPGAKGFSFGLLTFALFLGYLPVFYGETPDGFLPLFYTIGALVSLAFLWFALRRAKL